MKTYVHVLEKQHIIKIIQKGGNENDCKRKRNVSEGIIEATKINYRSPSFLVTNSDGRKKLLRNFSKLDHLYFYPVALPNDKPSLSCISKGIFKYKIPKIF